MVELANGDPRSRYQRYCDELSEDISETVQKFGSQPILFIGSGLSKRYFGAPSWEELLNHLAESCSLIDKGLGFYKQSLSSPMAIGEEFAAQYKKWAWTTGVNEFPKEMFSESTAASTYIKYKIVKYLESITPGSLAKIQSQGFSEEISALQAIKPHAIITTNYDQMLEILFPELTPIVGQQILKGQVVSVGEIFKIHGCVSDPAGLVFTAGDYDIFAKKKKFLSAKLLTFFNEHPLIFIGYSASDPNIKSILSDIDEALPEKGGVIPNIYILEWNKSIDKDSIPPREKVIPTEEDRSVRVKLIEASSFDWVFKAFSANPIMNNISPRILRALVARSYHLVRHDIPKAKVEADFQMLNSSVASSQSFAKLFGIASISDHSVASVHHKYSLTQLGQKLGGNLWHIADKAIKKLKADTGFDIKSCDNVYHRAEKVNKSVFHKYSDDAFDLLKKVRDGDQYDILKD